jgi:hypothetical protein
MDDRKHPLRTCLVAIAIAGALGCSSARVKVAPRPPETSQLGETVKGSGCGMLVFGMFPAGVNGRTQRAYDAALKGRGSSLTDVKINYSWYAIPYAGYLLCTEIEGRVVL